MHVCVVICVSVCHGAVCIISCVSAQWAAAMRGSISGLGLVPADIMNMLSARRVERQHGFLREQQVVKLCLISCMAASSSGAGGKMSRIDTVIVVTSVASVFRCEKEWSSNSQNKWRSECLLSRNNDPAAGGGPQVAVQKFKFTARSS